MTQTPVDPYSQNMAMGGDLPPMPSLGSSSGPGSSVVNSDNPLIYLGIASAPYQPVTPGGHEPRGDGFFANSSIPDTATVDQMIQNLEHMSIKEQHKLYAQLLVAGFSSTTIPLDKIADEVKNSAFQDLAASYSSFLSDLANRYTTRNQKITPDELLKQRIAYRFKAAGIDWNGDLDKLNLNSIIKLTTGAEDSLAGTKTSTYTSKDFMDPMDAKALVRATL